MIMILPASVEYNRLMSVQMCNNDLLNNLPAAIGLKNYYDRKSQNHVDYILASPNLEINNFHVLPDEVSDHCPVYLHFSLMPD